MVVPPLPDFTTLSNAQKDALIVALWEQVVSLTARLTALEQRLHEPAKTPDNPSVPSSMGQKPNRSDTLKPAGPRKGSLGGVVTGMDVLPPAPIEGQAMRTELGRPRSSMRLRTWTATSTSVARRSSACERRASPVTRLKRDMAVSARARLV